MVHWTTERLWLIPTPLEVLNIRLQHDEFDADITIDGTTRSIHFPPEWPGMALVLVPMLIELLKQEQDVRYWGGTLIDRADQIAVGQMGFKGPPDAHGMIELGYGINQSFWNRGYATEMARALITWAVDQPDVRRITAETLPTNRGSIRVLEKLGFQPTGERKDDEEGRVIVWQWDGFSHDQLRQQHAHLSHR